MINKNTNAEWIHYQHGYELVFTTFALLLSQPSSNSGFLYTMNLSRNQTFMCYQENCLLLILLSQHVGSDAGRLKQPVPQNNWQKASLGFLSTRTCWWRQMWIMEEPSPAQLSVSVSALIQPPILPLYLAQTFFFVHQYLFSYPPLNRHGSPGLSWVNWGRRRLCVGTALSVIKESGRPWFVWPQRPEAMPWLSPLVCKNPHTLENCLDLPSEHSLPIRKNLLCSSWIQIINAICVQQTVLWTISKSNNYISKIHPWIRSSVCNDCVAQEEVLDRCVSPS